MELQKSITLKHLLIDQKKHIGLQFSTNKIIQALIESLPNLSWSPEFKMYYIPNTKYNLELIYKIFQGVAWVNGNFFFSEKIINEANPMLNLQRYRTRKPKIGFKNPIVEIEIHIKKTCSRWCKCFETLSLNTACNHDSFV